MRGIRYPSQLPDAPGVQTYREHVGYDARQEALWQVFDDVYYAACFGFAHTRLPTPGRNLDGEEMAKYQERMIEAWNQEGTSRFPSSTAPIESGEMEPLFWWHITERMKDASQTK